MSTSLLFNDFFFLNQYFTHFNLQIVQITIIVVKIGHYPRYDLNGKGVINKPYHCLHFMSGEIEILSTVSSGLKNLVSKNMAP